MVFSNDRGMLFSSDHMEILSNSAWTSDLDLTVTSAKNFISSAKPSTSKETERRRELAKIVNKSGPRVDP